MLVLHEIMTDPVNIPSGSRILNDPSDPNAGLSSSAGHFGDLSGSFHSPTFGSPLGSPPFFGVSFSGVKRPTISASPIVGSPNPSQLAPKRARLGSSGGPSDASSHFHDVGVGGVGEAENLARRYLMGHEAEGGTDPAGGDFSMLFPSAPSFGSAFSDPTGDFEVVGMPSAFPSAVGVYGSVGWDRGGPTGGSLIGSSVGVGVGVVGASGIAASGGVATLLTTKMAEVARSALGSAPSSSKAREESDEDSERSHEEDDDGRESGTSDSASGEEDEDGDYRSPEDAANGMNRLNLHGSGMAVSGGPMDEKGSGSLPSLAAAVGGSDWSGIAYRNGDGMNGGLSDGDPSGGNGSPLPHVGGRSGLEGLGGTSMAVVRPLAGQGVAGGVGGVGVPGGMGGVALPTKKSSGRGHRKERKSGSAAAGSSGALPTRLRSDDDSFPQSRLAELYGLPGRFRDYKRSLFDNHKMKQPQLEFMDLDTEHRELTLRLPHRITAGQFAFRIVLMGFHFALRDGRLPSFWRKLAHETLFSCLGDDIRIRFDPSVGVRAHSYIQAGMSIAAAVAQAQSEVIQARQRAALSAAAAAAASASSAAAAAVSSSAPLSAVPSSSSGAPLSSLGNVMSPPAGSVAGAAASRSAVAVSVAAPSSSSLSLPSSSSSSISSSSSSFSSSSVALSSCGVALPTSAAAVFAPLSLASPHPPAAAAAPFSSSSSLHPACSSSSSSSSALSSSSAVSVGAALLTSHSAPSAGMNSTRPTC